MKAKWVGKGHRARPVMNVTPLVDVVLVLLIVFMVVIPAIEQGLAIEIPGIRNPDRGADGGNRTLVLSITAEGGLFLDDEEVSWSRLEPRLRAVAAQSPGKRVVLRGDKGAKYAHVRRAYRAVQQVGFAGVAMKVSHRQDGDAVTRRP